MPLTIRAMLILLACAACASARKPAPESASAAGAGSPARSSTIITRAEIEASTHRDAHELIQAMRPRWLRVRTVGNARVERVVVEVGSAQAGGVEMLRQIPLEAIESIEFSDAFDVSQRGASEIGYAGTIRVKLRTGR